MKSNALITDRSAIILFGFCLLTRFIFQGLSGYDHFELFADSYRYESLGTAIRTTGHHLDITAYIVAPLFPYTVAFFQSISPTHWLHLITLYQFVLVSASAVALFGCVRMLTQSHRTALLAGAIYICYPLTMWYNFTLVQENSFQAFFLFFIYFSIKFDLENKGKDLYLSSTFFALALLTKSHILIMLPFLILLWMWRTGIYSALRSTMVIVLICLPFSLLNFIHYDIVTLSSHGSGSLFLLGHNDQAYECLMSPAGKLKELHVEGCDADIVFDPDYEYADGVQVNALPPGQRNRLRYREAIEWIDQHPEKFLALKLHGFLRFVIPGVDIKQYRFPIWLGTFIAGILIYLPAYSMLLLWLKKRRHPFLIMLSSIIILNIALLFIIFFPMHRFRVITMDPLLIILSVIFYRELTKKRLSRLLETASSKINDTRIIF